MKLLALIMIIFQAVIGLSGIRSTLSNKGFPAKVTILVLDDNEEPISNGDAQFAFCFYTKEKPIVIRGKTSIEGIISAEEKTNRRVVIQVHKEGYYRSCYEYNVWQGSKGYETGRWEPWNPTIKIKLRKIINPNTTDRVYKVFQNLDPSEKYIFDFLKGELQSSKNDQISGDFVVSAGGSYYSRNIGYNDDWIATDSFVFSGEGNGIIKKTKDSVSQLKYSYEAPLDGYTSCVDYCSVQEKNRVTSPHKYPSETYEYLVFRISRTTEDEKTLYYYGVIDSWNIGKDWRTGKIDFTISYRLNPEPGDRNIEYN